MAGSANSNFEDPNFNEEANPHALPLSWDPKKDCHEVDYSDPLALCGTERVMYRYVPSESRRRSSIEQC